MSQINHYLQAVGAFLDSGDILTGGVGFQRFLKTTFPVDRRVPAVLMPRSADQVRQIVEVSREFRQPLHVVSTGKNWGYGCALPSVNNSVIVSLEKMTAIKFDSEDLGTIWIEPGVTQEMLYEFLRERAPHFVTPVTGSSPECSVLGNALERGFGIAPLYDHALAIQALEAVLPSGQTYRSPFLEIGAHQSAGVFRYGIGPHLDSLFPQGSFGIVTRAIIQLKRVAEEYLTAALVPRPEISIGHALEACRRTFNDIGLEYSPLKVFNARYVQDLYRADINLEKGAPRKVKSFQFGSFAICGVFPGSRAIVNATRAEIRTRLKAVLSHATLMDTRQFAQLEKIMGLFPASWFPATRFKINNVSMLHRYTRGIPSRSSLSLVYGPDRQRAGGTRTGNPAVDGSGLLWLPLICQFTAQSFDTLSDIVVGCCREFGFPEIINATSLSPTTMCLLVSLLFNPEVDRDRAHQCMSTLIKRTLAAGYAPYRVHSEYFSHLFDVETSPYCKITRNLRAEIDPEGILSPRYPFNSAS